MRYTIELCGEAVEVDVRALAPGRYQIRVGGAEPRTVDARAQEGLVHLVTALRSFAVAQAPGGQALQAHARGIQAPLQVLDERALRLRARRNGGTLGAAGRVVRSPMPGRVVKVLVAEGDHVKAGQGVVIVEAMKMENELRAEIAGVVQVVKVRAGDLVEGNAELVTLEAAGE